MEELTSSWIYWIIRADTIRIIMFLLLGLSLVAWVGVVTAYVEYEDVEKIKKVIRFLLPITIISFLGLIFIPSSDTLIKMKLIQFATTENIELAYNTLLKAVEDVARTIKGA